jgi:archaeal flagellar protein FlaF
MAVSEIIGAAVGVILLIIVAYVIVSGTLFAGETMANTQKDVTLQQEIRMRTHITLDSIEQNKSILHANITNDGSEIIGDFKHVDVLVYDSSLTEPYQLFPYASGDPVLPSTWGIENTYGEFIHKNELDPGEVYRIRINSAGDSPSWFQITTANGVYDSAFV